MRKINRVLLNSRTQGNLEWKKAKLCEALSNWITDKQIKDLQKWYALNNVKSTLNNMQNYKWNILCCYCETKNSNSPFEIEHVKPKWKSWYEKFCFDWDNLLYSCRYCNGSYKQDNYEAWFLNPSDTWYSFDSNFDFDEKCFYIAKNSNAELTRDITKLNEKDKHSFKSRLELMNILQKNLEEYKEDKLSDSVIEKYIIRDFMQRWELDSFWNWLLWKLLNK